MTEAEIRNALISHLSASPVGAGAAFISEMFVNGFSRRADLVMANGKLAAFEIKSERDTLNRLTGQLSTYSDFFEQVTVVCAEKHLPNVEALTDKRVGIWSINANGQISVIRNSKTTALPSLNHWISFLPVDELRQLLKEHGSNTRGNRENLILATNTISARSVRTFVLDYLKRRDQKIARLKSKRTQTQTRATSNPTALNEQKLSEYLKTISCAAEAIPRRRNHSSYSSSSSNTSSAAKRSEKSI